MTTIIKTASLVLGMAIAQAVASQKQMPLLPTPQQDLETAAVYRNTALHVLVWGGLCTLYMHSITEPDRKEAVWGWGILTVGVSYGLNIAAGDREKRAARRLKWP